MKRRFCKQIASALHEGTERRRGLPIEVVARIFHLSTISIPAPELDQSVRNEFWITDHSGGGGSKYHWMDIPMPDELTMRKLANLKLVTFSGQLTTEWSERRGWFELAILSPPKPEALPLDPLPGSPPGWPAHIQPRPPGEFVFKERVKKIDGGVELKWSTLR